MISKITKWRGCDGQRSWPMRHYTRTLLETLKKLAKNICRLASCLLYSRHFTHKPKLYRTEACVFILTTLRKTYTLELPRSIIMSLQLTTEPRRTTSLSASHFLTLYYIQHLTVGADNVFDFQTRLISMELNPMVRTLQHKKLRTKEMYFTHWPSRVCYWQTELECVIQVIRCNRTAAIVAICDSRSCRLNAHRSIGNIYARPSNVWDLKVIANTQCKTQ